MIKAILVDDETHALEALRNALSSIGFIEVADVFTNPLEAIDYCRKERIDAVFLDIEMPGMNGLEASEKIQEVCDAEVVFVTAYDHYAVEAFEVNAVDYLLKPVSPKRAAKTAERLLASKRTHPDDKRPDSDAISCRIHCFGRFDVIVIFADDREEMFKWRMTKAKELFAYLLHHRGRVIHKSRIMDTLWPDMDAHRAKVYLHTCVYQIRKLIKAFGLENKLAVVLINEGYELKMNSVDCDLDVFVRETADLSLASTLENIDGLIKLADIYQGNYFDEEGYPWASDSQYAYLLTYQELLLKLVAFHQESGEHAKSVAWLLRLIASDPYREEFHAMLLDAYGRTGNRDAFIQHFQQLRSMFRSDLGIDLPASVNQLPARWDIDIP